ncbi:hypothetical protein ACN47E_010333 [Coniothyrium glycines]
MAGLQPASRSSKPRTSSISQESESSQTAAEFIKEQLSLEQEAREALPYQFDTCTRDLGPLRQSLYACLTCNPASASPAQQYNPAAVCYSCSIACHGEHTLVELFNKRNFICDCGTTRMPEMSPCTLQINSETGQKGDVTGKQIAESNRYNQNFQNKFCGCGENYDAHQEKGTMFQCLGLGTCEDGGCGEDWWHPECLVGFSRAEYTEMVARLMQGNADGVVNAFIPEVGISSSVPAQVATSHAASTSEPTSELTAVVEANHGVDGEHDATDVEHASDDPPLPPGFPAEDDFDHFLCYKCVQANPWVKRYANSSGFLPPVFHDKDIAIAQADRLDVPVIDADRGKSTKRKVEEDDIELESTSSAFLAPAQAKRQKSEDPSGTHSSICEATGDACITTQTPESDSVPKHARLPYFTDPVPTIPFSLFLKPDFRDHFCRCSECFPQLKAHPQLLEEEDTYEPPLTEDGDEGVQSVGTGSLLDRGEAAFNNMDRVRAIQGAMAYAHLKDKVAAFLKPFAESGQAVGAEDVKAYFEKLRGDEQGIQDAAGGAKASRNDKDGGADGGSRREQSGY